MKKFTLGITIGLLIGLLTASTFSLAGTPIKLFVNGQEITCDVPPQNINGRVMVPARYVAEALGASVAWDTANNAVVITGQQSGGTLKGLPSVKPTKNIESFWTDSNGNKEPIRQGWVGVRELLVNYGCTQLKSAEIKELGFQNSLLLKSSNGKYIEIKFSNDETKICDSIIWDTSSVQAGTIQTQVSNGRTWLLREDLVKSKIID